MKGLSVIIIALMVVVNVSGCSKDSGSVKNGEIRGIDVSHFQGTVNWEDIKKDNISFAMAKASEGITAIDPDFRSNWEGIKKAGLVRGAYHFYIAEDDPVKQAETFLKLINKLGVGDLPAVLDIERGGYAKGSIDNEAFQRNVLIWLKKVEIESGKKPIIYTGCSFADKHLKKSEFADYKLWIAEYCEHEPALPKIWEINGYTFWQKSSSDELHGVKGKVDYDLYNGSGKEFGKLTGTNN